MKQFTDIQGPRFAALADMLNACCEQHSPCLSYRRCRRWWDGRRCEPTSRDLSEEHYLKYLAEFERLRVSFTMDAAKKGKRCKSGASKS